MNRRFEEWRIVVIGFAFTVVAAWTGRWFPGCHTISFPGVAIAFYWLHIHFWEHMVAFSCLVIALNTFIYSALFALSLSLSRYVGGRAKRAWGKSR
ncbi:MAG TPA: hypothetical protein VFB04_15920 [Terriglobales bacterium]|nr:hypothetical protein [Terriglobales bacterium]